MEDPRAPRRPQRRGILDRSPRPDLRLGASGEPMLQRIGAPIVAWSSWIVAVVRVERHLRRESAGAPRSEAGEAWTPA